MQVISARGSIPAIYTFYILILNYLLLGNDTCPKSKKPVALEILGPQGKNNPTQSEPSPNNWQQFVQIK